MKREKATSAHTPDPPGAMPEEVDALYGLPLEEFTKARNALADQLRSKGDRKAAERVRGLAKPTTAAWAVNQVMRTQRRDARALLAAGARLRKAHEGATTGNASARDLREAVEAEREIVGRLTQAASGLVNARGRGLSEGILERVTQTLHALSADGDVRTPADASRLSSERQATGAGAFDAPLGKERPRKSASAGSSVARARKLRERLQRAQQEARDLRSRRSRAVRGASDAEQALVRARDELRQAERKAADKENEIDDLRRRLEELK